MGWVYLVKRRLPSGFGPVVCYLGTDGKFNSSRERGWKFETEESAEAKAFALVAKHPDWIGRLSVVRCSELI